ncbi:RrF2 family transcriptional regulator [Candidatus Poribacteria bacterium]
MELSTRAQYGARLMLELALHYGEGPIPLRGIAQSQEISEKYLWNLMNPLKTTGLIRSTRGSRGGFALIKPPSEINMKDIVIALEGSLCLVECVADPSVCMRARICVTRDIWSAVSKNVMETLESITLEDLVEKQMSKGVSSPNYEI